MKPALFISQHGAIRRAEQLVALKEAAFCRVLPTRNLAADRTLDRGFRVALFNRAGLQTGFAMEAL